MKNGHWQPSDEFMESQKRRTVKDITLNIENKVVGFKEPLDIIAKSSKLQAYSIAGTLIFFCILILVKELKGTNFSMAIKDWFNVVSSVAEGRK